MFAGHVLLETGKPTEALEEARRAQQDGKGNPPEWGGLFLEAIAHEKLGRTEDADRAAERLRQRTAPIPTDKEKRRHRHLIGELALARGETARAIEELETARSMLPPRGRGGNIFEERFGAPQHVPVWFSLASACMTSDDDDEAAEWFERITESTVERVEWPIPYVRSFYFLGKIHENRGETEKAREYYQRFADFWRDGDIERSRIEEAMRKISTGGSPSN